MKIWEFLANSNAACRIWGGMDDRKDGRTSMADPADSATYAFDAGNAGATSLDFGATFVRNLR